MRNTASSSSPRKAAARSRSPASRRPEGFDLSGFIKNLKTKHNFLINGGYGKIKGTTFRISNMGNETEATMQELIDAMDDVLG